MMLVCGPITVHRALRRVSGPDGQALQLTMAMFLIVEALALANGNPVGRDALCLAALKRTLNISPDGPDRSVDQLVHVLNRVLPRDEFGGMFIRSVRGIGYWMQAPASAPVLTLAPAVAEELDTPAQFKPTRTVPFVMLATAAPGELAA